MTTSLGSLNILSSKKSTAKIHSVILCCPIRFLSIKPFPIKKRSLFTFASSWCYWSQKQPVDWERFSKVFLVQLRECCNLYFSLKLYYNKNNDALVFILFPRTSCNLYWKPYMHGVVISDKFTSYILLFCLTLCLKCLRSASSLGTENDVCTREDVSQSRVWFHSIPLYSDPRL